MMIRERIADLCNYLLLCYEFRKTASLQIKLCHKQFDNTIYVATLRSRVGKVEITGRRYNKVISFLLMRRATIPQICIAVTTTLTAITILYKVI